MDEAIRKVGYVGLGIMGEPMAMNLLKAGNAMTVWNRTPGKAETLVGAGATLADSPAAVAAEVEVLFVNVTDTPDVEAVLFGEQGVARGAEPGLIVIDNSTINAGATQDFAQRLAGQGVTLLDAPVSGGDIGAQRGTLSIMVGGPEDAVAKVRPLLDVIGKSITHVGPVGMGQVCKSCNQVACAGALMGACEALALAKRNGLDLDKMIEVVGAGAAGSWQLSNLGPKIAADDHAPGFMIDYMLKDLAIVADLARANQLPLSGAALAEAYLRAVAAQGGGRLGTQAMGQALERLGAFTFSD